MKFKPLIFICFVVTSYINLSCACRGPVFSKELIDDSDLIFEGYLSDIDYDEETEENLVRT